MSDVEGVEDGAAGGHVAQGLIQVHGATWVVGVDAGGGVLHAVGGVGAHGGHQQRRPDLPVAAGSQADLVLLAEDPLRLGAEELAGVHPVATVVAGAVAHLRG